MGVFRTFDEMISKAASLGKRRLALVQATSPMLLRAVNAALKLGFVEPVLIGPKDRISDMARQLGIDLGSCQIVHHTGSDEEAVKIAIDLANSGDVHLIMKGQLPTATYLRHILSRKSGIRQAKVVSHVAFAQAPNYHKVFGGTDGGVILHPNFEEKAEIARNGITLMRMLGYDVPKVGLLAYSEKAREDDPETWDWVKLCEMAERGEFGPVQMAGPLGFDMMFDKESAKIKGFEHPIAGDVDLYIAPYITACNASIKAIYLNGGQAAGILVGTKVPVLMLSRADSDKTRLNTMALGVLTAHGIEEHGGWG